jgi:hypothetical protein
MDGMMKTSLILTMLGLLFLLIMLVFLYVWIGRIRKSPPVIVEEIETFDSLRGIINNRGSTNAQLNHAAARIIERFSYIDSRHIGAYKHLVETLCVHPHTDSKLILRVEKALRAANPAHIHEIEQALAIGLASRGQHI